MNPKDTESKSGQTRMRPTAKSGAADLATAAIDPTAIAMLIQQQELRQKVDQLAMDAMMAGEDGDSTAKLLRTLSEIATETKAAGLTSAAGLIAEMRRALEDSPAQPEAFLANITRLQQAIDNPESIAPPNGEKVRTASKAPVSLAADPELVADFLVEARDHLTAIESHLLTLEQDPGNTDAIHTIFRGFHTIKGLAGFLEFTAIQEVAHEVETLLDMARNGQLSINSTVVDVVLESADYLKSDIGRIEDITSGNAGDAEDNRELIARIQAQMHPPAHGSSRNEKSRHEEGRSPKSQGDDSQRDLLGTSVAMPERMAPAPDAQGLKQDAKEAMSPEAKAALEARKAANAESRVVKIDTNKLDFLVDMVGELVIAQSMVRHDGHLNTISNPKLQRNLSQLARITGEVQKTAMQMRMVPIGQLFQRSVRLVRDLGRKANKKAELELSGEDTELDRTIVADLADPLMHMIRNSMDHGIETAAERVAAGKSPVAKIELKAYHQAGHIVIEVVDDGRGLNREKILAKARERGLVQEGAQLSDKEVFNLIFEPGFSTADKITDISGRGVGMDVVRKQLQRMRGRVDIESKAGQGTTFYLKLPLTLAIIDGLVVGVGEERYIMPIYVIHEMFRPSADAVFTVEGRHEMVLVRGALLPVTRLYQHFGVTPRSTDLPQSVVVVAETGDKRVCVMVDELIGKQEVVIKGLGETFKQVTGVAGGAILGDGRVALILDMDGLFGEAVHG
jgi:two-component system, chemotaxis family, sensor kinase CheA